MNENIPVTNEASVITSLPESSYSNDVIDLTDVNDSDECEVTSSSSVIVSNTSANPQQPERNLARNRGRKNSNSSADDSISIIYENIQPPPDIEFLNEVVTYDRGENASFNNDSLSLSIPPIIMGSFSENPVPFYPETSNERTSSIPQPINYSTNARVLQPAPHHSSLPSCKYATPQSRGSRVVSVVATCPVPLQSISLPLNEVPVHSKTIPDNIPSQSSGLENSNNREVRVPKIQCGICLDGPDEIAASNRNFTSTNCGHVFCNICIATSLKKANKCPNCRKKVTSRQIHPLYL